jgi:hypothetical protein
MGKLAKQVNVVFRSILGNSLQKLIQLFVKMLQLEPHIKILSDTVGFL